MGEAAEVLHTAIKNYIEFTCNPISPPIFEYVKQYKKVSEKNLSCILGEIK